MLSVNLTSKENEKEVSSLSINYQFNMFIKECRHPQA